MTRRSFAAAVAGCAAVAALVVAGDLALRPSPPDEALVARAVDRARAERARDVAWIARDLDRAADRDTALADALAQLPDDARWVSARVLAREGAVRASRDAPSPPPSPCGPLVIERPLRDGQRLVVTFADDCATRARADAARVPRDASASYALHALAVAAALATALGVAWWLSRRTTRHVALLARAVERVGAGDLSARVRPRGDDPLDPLIAAFNQMVDELAQSRSRIDYLQRMAGWQEFARRLAHEIKNPLTPIQLAVQELAKKYRGDDAKFQRTLDTAREVVEEEVATLRRLVGAFSEFARLPEVKRDNGDLAEFARDMATSQAFLDEAAGEAAARRAGVEFSIVDGAVPVFIDRMMLRRAVENLVRNAVQAIGTRGGTVWVRVEAHPDAPDGPQAWLVVEDNGPGIPAAQQARVFDPYFTTKPEGTGLGLAIVRKIALDHDGDVGLEDRPGGGARFVFTLPLRVPGRRSRLSFVTYSKSAPDAIARRAPDASEP